MDTILKGVPFIHLRVERACGCVEDHGHVVGHHDADLHDPHVVRSHLLRRLVDSFDHADINAALRHAETLTLAELHDHLVTTLAPLYRPQRFLARCDGTACTSTHPEAQ